MGNNHNKKCESKQEKTTKKINCIVCLFFDVNVLLFMVVWVEDNK